MTKNLLVVTILVFSCLAQAEIYHSAEDTAAVIYFMQDQNTVNALLCNETDKPAAKALMKLLKSDPLAFKKENCRKLLGIGVTLASVGKLIPEIKQQYTIFLSTFNQAMQGLAESFTNDKKTVERVEDIFSTLTAQQKTTVEQINADYIFSNFVSKTKIMFVESVDSIKLNKKVATLMQFAQ